MIMSFQLDFSQHRNDFEMGVLSLVEVESLETIFFLKLRDPLGFILNDIASRSTIAIMNECDRILPWGKQISFFDVRVMPYSMLHPTWSYSLLMINIPQMNYVSSKVYEILSYVLKFFLYFQCASSLLMIHVSFLKVLTTLYLVMHSMFKVPLIIMSMATFLCIFSNLVYSI